MKRKRNVKNFDIVFDSRQLFIGPHHSRHLRQSLTQAKILWTNATHGTQPI